MLAERAAKYSLSAADLEAQRTQERLTQLQKLEKQQTKSKIIFKEKAMVFCVIGAILLMAFGFSMLEARIGIAGHRISETREAIAQAENINQRVELEIADLSSLSRIEEYAFTKLGMTYPQFNDIAYLNYQLPQTVQVAQFAALAEGEVKIIVEDPPTEEAALTSPLLMGIYKLFSDHFSRYTPEQDAG